MKSKLPSIRVSGQSSIHSTLLFRSSNRSVDCKEDVQCKAPNKNSPVSLSDFLDRKLHKSSVLPKSVQGKERPFLSPVGGGDVSGSIKSSVLPKSVQGKEMPFLSPVGGGDVSGSIKVEFGAKKRGEKEENCVFDVDLEKLRHTGKGKEDCIHSCATVGGGSSHTDYMEKSRKIKNPFEGGVKKQYTRKPLVVLGDDPKPKPIRKKESFTSNKKPRILYNHYANGSGWWDCNMEGVDNEEVGCNEVWEGIGTTALGGLEWH
ncbi:uncharacterized protein LOC132299928 [Cornus florida]|uniref:uncharacterized protein LOC132299928 n=1 Tax=Cornus florida TaxID=4283 RepID=UPI00289AAD02|nr:uncharacterized protein LOC132299928 [Cornus florida]